MTELGSDSHLAGEASAVYPLVFTEAPAELRSRAEAWRLAWYRALSLSLLSVLHTDTHM